MKLEQFVLWNSKKPIILSLKSFSKKSKRIRLYNLFEKTVFHCIYLQFCHIKISQIGAI